MTEEFKAADINGDGVMTFTTTNRSIGRCSRADEDGVSALITFNNGVGQSTPGDGDAVTNISTLDVGVDVLGDAMNCNRVCTQTTANESTIESSTSRDGDGVVALIGCN